MDNYKDTLLQSAVNTMDDRGLGTPTPRTDVGITPPGSAQGDYAAGTLPGRNAPSLIPPELQSIIDKVTGSSVSEGRKVAALASLGGTVGGLHQQRMTEAGQMRRLGVTGAQELEKTKIMQAGGIEQQKIATAPGMGQLNLAKKAVPSYLQNLITKNLGVGGKGETETGEEWWKKYSDIGNY